MRRMILASVIILLIVTLVAFHLIKIHRICDEIIIKSSEVFIAYDADDWDKIYTETREISDIWQKNRFWSTLTLPTAQIDEIEISLEQSIRYAELEAKPDFIGEFKMFYMLVEHIPRQEGLSIEELF